MKEHSNLYRILVKDQEENPMPMDCVIRVLVLILREYEKIYPLD